MQTDSFDDPTAAHAGATEAHFATLSTGERWMEQYSDADGDGIDEVGCHLMAALAGEPLPMPRFPQLVIAAVAESGCCAVRLFNVFSGEPVLSIGIGGVIDEGVDLWRAMHRTHTDALPHPISPYPPRGPWCATRYDAGVRHLQPGEIDELIHMAGCFGWAWLLLVGAVG